MLLCSRASRRLSQRTGTRSFPSSSGTSTTLTVSLAAELVGGSPGKLERGGRGFSVASLACVSTWLEDFRPDLARIDIPTLVIHGGADRIVPIDAAGRRTAELVAGARA